MMRLKLKSLRRHKVSINVFVIQTCMSKTVRFPSRHEQVLSSRLSLPQEKHQLLKIWTNLKFTNFSEKSKSMVVSPANQRVISIPYIQEYLDLQNLSNSHHLAWGYWGWLHGLYFKRLGPQGGQGICYGLVYKIAGHSLKSTAMMFHKRYKSGHYRETSVNFSF